MLCPGGGEGNIGNTGLELTNQLVFGDKRLGAGLSHFFGTAVVNISDLTSGRRVVFDVLFGGNCPSAFVTTDQASEGKVVTMLSGFTLKLDLFLNLVKQIPGNELFVNAFMFLAGVGKYANVKGVSEHDFHRGLMQYLPTPAMNSVGSKKLTDILIAVLSGRKQFKCLFDNRRFLSINLNCSGLRTVKVAMGCLAWPDTITDFLPQPSADILTQIVHIVFRLAKGNVEHKLALGGVLKPERGKFKAIEFADIQKIDDPSSVNRVSGKTVWVPG